MYEAQADTINVDNIATNSNNRIVLRRLQRNNANDTNNELYIHDEHDDEDQEEDCDDYYPESPEDMGWLGYFVGKNQHLEKLSMTMFEPNSGSSVRDVIVPFLRGVNNNKSIREIGFYSMNLLEGEILTMLGPFFKNNHNLTNINIARCDFGDEGSRLFALAIGSCKNKSLQSVELGGNSIADEGMVDIITSLSIHPRLKHLVLRGNLLRKNGCVALATLLQCSSTELQYLNISNNEINDEGIEALVPALATCSHLKELHLFTNPSVTTKGWQSLATILEAPNSNLCLLYIARNNIDDEAVASFASSLANNCTLTTLYLNDNPITDIGWEAFDKLLCNTSSVNTTFLSNHTLQYVGTATNENDIIGPLLALNRRDDKKEVATIKILQTHADFDMLPFFEWEFKVLPMVIGWLEKASECEMPADFEPNIEPRKLSTIYQFVRGMPVLYVETRLRKELEDIKEELPRLDQRKLLLLERQRSILTRLGRR